MKHASFLEPVITEKSMGLASHKWYSFKVGTHLTKAEIAGIVEEQFKVHVANVRTITMPGKTKRTGKRRTEQSRAPWKKALVQVKNNEKIDLFAVETAPQK